MDFRRQLLILAIVAGCIWVLSPLLLPLAMGGVFAALFYPWHVKLVKKKMPPYLSSALITLGVTFGFLLPTIFLIITGTKIGMQKIGTWDVLKGVQGGVAAGGGGFFETLVDSLLAKPTIRTVMNSVTDFFPLTSQEIADSLREMAQTIGVRVGALLATLIAHIPSLLFTAVVMVVSIFFFLADGARMALFVRKNSAFSPFQTERLMSAFSGMCRSVVLASLASGFAQALLFWIACASMGVSDSFFVGLLVFFMSFIPLIGAAPVTFLIGLHHLLMVDNYKGIVLLVAAMAVSMVDNFVRPMVLRGASNLHPLLAFVAAFGGLQVFGVAGVFLGPVIVGVFLAMVDVLTQSHSVGKV
jgi:predicted PurR-regulated permease PerM